jgi:uncharacterized protein YjiS (DUF1127 family)
MAIDTMSAEAGHKPEVSLLTVAVHAWRVYRAWWIKRRTRHSLLELTQEQLLDIGISRADAKREVRKSFYWD